MRKMSKTYGEIERDYWKRVADSFAEVEEAFKRLAEYLESLDED